MLLLEKIAHRYACIQLFSTSCQWGCARGMGGLPEKRHHCLSLASIKSRLYDISVIFSSVHNRCKNHSWFAVAPTRRVAA